MSNQSFVIVGTGQAGGWAARTLRDEGFEGRVVLVGEEDFPPYERPPLSKQVLLGEAPVETAFLWPEAELREKDVKLDLGRRVARINRTSRQVILDDGGLIPFDRLLLATGARARRLDVRGSRLPGVLYLRTIPDMLAIRERIPQARRVLIVGGGWIGLEVAAAARKLGAEVTVVEIADRVCSRAIPPTLSEFLHQIHEEHGVDIRCSTAVERFEGNDSLTGALLSDGTRVKAGIAVIGVGILPNSELAESAGLEVSNGIVVDELCRTSDPEIFAAGDVTNHPNPLLGRRVRLESWENAQNQGIHAARAMLERGQAYSEIPWFWSDQYDLNIQLAGLPESWDQHVIRGEIASRRFSLFYLQNGRLVGASGVNRGGDVRMARRLMQAGTVVTAEELADPRVKLQRLLRRKA